MLLTASTNSEINTPELMHLGLRSYREVWVLQQQLQQDLMTRTGKEALVFCEHTPVITVGRSAKEGNVLLEPKALARRKIELLHIERGGDVTYHGPGQLVLYPILDLRLRRQDVGWYMRLLEEAIIRTLSDFGVVGTRVADRTGVWVNDTKIAAIGVRISRWCTMHGLSINVLDQRAGFSLINPCGFKGLAVTSLEQLGKSADVSGVAKLLESHMLELL